MRLVHCVYINRDFFFFFSLGGGLVRVDGLFFLYEYVIIFAKFVVHVMGCFTFGCNLALEIVISPSTIDSLLFALLR